MSTIPSIMGYGKILPCVTGCKMNLPCVMILHFAMGCKTTLPTVMSTNIQIFEYSNKIALKYYLYLYHSPSTNIFGYSFIDFWTTENTKYCIFSNICFELYYNICLSCLLNNESLGILHASNKHPVKIYFKDSMNEPFSKLIQSVMSMNVLIFQ